MALELNNLVTRWLLMEQQGVERDEALKYAAVLSVNDAAGQSLTATDLGVTFVVGQRKAEEAAPALVVQPPVVPAALVAGLTFKGEIKGQEFRCEFGDASSGPVDKWEWDFGDGDKSADKDPVHTYKKPGSYTVTLAVEGGGAKATAKALVAWSLPAPAERVRGTSPAGATGEPAPKPA